MPLPTLLSHVLGRLTAEAEAEAKAGDAAPSLPVWDNVLRCLAGGALPERELPAAARVSKRLAAAAITMCSNGGWVEVSPATGKQRVLSPSAAGAKALDIWPGVLAEVDRSWADTPLREVLEEIVSRLSFELPHFPASYGSADPSAIGGPFMQYVVRKDGLPAHGTDWRPVLRGAGDTVSSLPITALLSQALMAFTIDYEESFPWPLASTANVLAHIGTTPTPLSALPANHGITGKGKSLLERHLIVSVTEQGAALTDRGELVRKNHPNRLAATEAIWRERYGGDSVEALRAALMGPASSAGDHPAHVMWSASY